MNAGSPPDPARKTRFEESDAANDPLWSLLAQSPRPEPDAWFAARTLARCRLEGRTDAGLFSLPQLVRMWRWTLGGGLALCMAVAFAMTQIQSEKADNQKQVQEAFEIVAAMNTDSDSSSSSSWQDSSL